MAKAYYYKINLKRNKDEKGKKIEETLGVEELKNTLKKIIGEEKSIILNESKKIKLDILHKGNLLDTLTEEESSFDDCDYIFCRMGKPKDIANVGERDESNLTIELLKKKEGKSLEIFTYFYLFFDLGVIIYLNEQSAPNIKEFSQIKKIEKNENTYISIVPIVSDDVIDVISKKQNIKKIEYTLSLPSDEILGYNGVGLSESEFDKIRDDTEMQFSISLNASRKRKGKTIFNNSVTETFKNSFFGKIIEKESLKKIKCTAMNDDEKVKEYNMLDDKLCQKVELKYKTEEGDFRRKEIQVELLKIYNDEKKDIKKYIS